MLKLWQLSFRVVCFPARRGFLERHLVHTTVSFPPGKLVREENFFCSREKKKGGNIDMELCGSLLLTGGACCTKCHIMHARKTKRHETTSCAKHISFTDARGLRPALYKGLHAAVARLVQKVVAGADHGNRALWVKLAMVLNVPGVAHR